MSWHYLQEQEAASWEGNSLDGAPDALLKLIPTAATCYSQGSETGTSRTSQSGMTSAPLMADHGEGKSTSCQAGWWEVEPPLGRVVDELADRVGQLRALGNGQVPAVVELAWRELTR